MTKKPSSEQAGTGQKLLARLRLFVLAAAVGLSIFAVWKGSWFGVLAWVLIVVFLIDNSVSVLFDMYDAQETRRLGFLFWIYSIFLGTRGVQLVRTDGSMFRRRPTGPLADLFGRFGAPGMTIIANGIAVVFERSGRFTRVHGPGVTFTQRFEFVAHVVDLRPQLRTISPVKKIMTQDGLSFDLDRLDALFEIATDFDPQKGEYSFSEEAILDLVYRGGLIYKKGAVVEWGDRVVAVVETVLRNVAASYTLADLVRTDSGSVRKRFMEEIEDQAGRDLAALGVHLRGIDMGQIVVPGELMDLLTLPLKQIVDLGLAHTQRDAIIGIAEGLRQAVRSIEESVPEEARGALPQLLLRLTDTLGGLSEEFLQMAGPYREGPESKLLPSKDEEKPAEENTLAEERPPRTE